MVSNKAKDVLDVFKVITYANPTVGAFRLRLQGSPNNPVTKKTTDMYGRNVETITNLQVGEEVRFGDRYLQGTYFANVEQNGKKLSVKLVKM
jgi:hypothetical protein